MPRTLLDRRRLLACSPASLATAAVSGCAKPSAGQAAMPAPTPAASAAPALPPPPTQSFADWLAEFRRDAAAQGIRPATLDRALHGIQPIPRVIELDHRQPETTLTYAEYMAHVVTPARVGEGRSQLRANRPLLEQIAGRYGVAPCFIVALWGIESRYGTQIGSFPIVASLATLAYDGRRGAFFRKELIAALRILDAQPIAPEALRGSWAGAMGQTQFMPTSYLKYAVDYSGKGEADIWYDHADVFASIANYLAGSGWVAGEGWGWQAALPAAFDPALVANLKDGPERPLSGWQALGVEPVDGAPARRETLASIVQPDGTAASTLLVTRNYRVLLKWNRSLFFACAVSSLADRIAT